MLFDKEILSFRILDVLRLDQKQVQSFNTRRSFSALSFRIRSDAVLVTQEKTLRLCDNAVAYIPPHLDYTRRATRDELIVVHFHTTDYQAFSIESFVAAPHEPLADRFCAILDAWQRRESSYQLTCSALFYEILALCYQQNAGAIAPPSALRPAVEHMYASFARPDLTTREVAEHVYMSEVYFRRLFKREYGISPHRFLVRLRLQNAVSLITAGYHSLREVAQLSGYNDYKYFSVEFKRHIGVSPSAYLYTPAAFRDGVKDDG